MGVKVGQLYQELTIDDKKFNKKLGRAKSKTSKLSTTMKKGFAVAATSAVAIGAALAGAATKGVKEFMKYEKQMNEVFTLMPEASDKMKNQLSDDLKSFSEEMGVLTDDATPALYQAISAGVPKDNVFSFLEQAQKASVGAITDLETSVDALTSVTNTYGTENITAKETSDLLFTAVKQGKTTFEELAGNISAVAPIASSLGIEFSNITAALSTMTSQGTTTAKATTQLKTAMSELSKEGSKAGKAFKDVAGKSFPDFIEEGGNLQEALVLMEEAARKNDTTVGNMFGSVEAGQAALALTGESTKKFKEDLDAANDSAGATEEAYKTMNKSLSRSFDKIQASVKVLWIEIGEKLEPIVADFANWIKDNMPQIKETTLAVFDAIVDSIYFVKDAYDVIKKAVMSFFKDNRSTLNSIYSDYDEIFNLVFEIVETFIAQVTKFWDKYGEDIVKKAKVAFDLLKRVFKTKLAIIKDALQAVLALMTGDWEGFGEELGQMMTKAFKLVRDLITSAWKKLIKPALNALIKKIIEVWKDLPGKVKKIAGDVVSGFVDGLTGKAGEAVDAIVGWGGSIIKGLKDKLDSKSPSQVFMRIGEDVVNGLTIGIANKANEPEKELLNIFENLTGGKDVAKDGEKSKLDTSVFGKKGKKGGQAFGEQFTSGVLNTIDLMTPTEKAIAAGLKVQKEQNKKMLQSKQEYMSKWEQILFEQNATELELLEKSKKNALTNLEEKAQKTKMSEKEIEKLRTKIKRFYSNKRTKIEEAEENQLLADKKAFINKWKQKLFKQNATELELLEKSKQNALTNLKEKAQKTEMTVKEIGKLRTKIKRFYSNKRTKIEEAEETQLLAAQKAFMSKWKQKLFEQNATELELLEKGKEDAINNAKERAKKLELTEKELQKTITNIKKVYSNRRKNINKEELEDSATFWEQIVYHTKQAGITIKSVTQDMANSIVDMFDSNYQAELAFKEKTAEIKDDMKEQIQDLINKRDEELKAVGDNAEEKAKINKKYSELIADLKQAERDELTNTK